MHKVSAFLCAAMLALIVSALAGAAPGTDSMVTVGSNPSPFAQNKQNEPAMAIDANHPNIVVAGANDNIDMEDCNAGADNTCPFTPGVGVSGVYFSFDSGNTWTQPTYTGWSARNCHGVPGPDPGCSPIAGGPIGTIPWYYENGIVSDGDPAVAFGPRPDASGHFSWSNGSRLYYANLTSNFGATRDEASFKGFEAIGVSRTDDVRAAAAGNKNAWMQPVIVSKQVSQTIFSDKEQVWADNASTSPFFGTVYLCWASFRGQEKSPNAAPAPLFVGVSHDGGNTWTQQQVTPAANNGQRNPTDGCTVRTDSNGTAYVFGVGTVSSQGHDAFELMSKSTDGGTSWSNATPVAGPVTQPGQFDPLVGPVIDGVAGARSDLAPAPSVDIANGAPTGTDATNRIVMSYVSGDLAKPHVYFTESTNGGTSWSTPRPIESGVDRGYYTAPAISPNGTDVYVVYNAFTLPFQPTTATLRQLVGVVMHATAGATGPTRAFTEIHRSPPGDPRGSAQNNLVGEFLGDYVYAAATRTYGAAVWNDTRNAADCPAIDAYRQALENGIAATAPDVQQQCPATFGNSDIWAFTTAP
jgi:hypothetical protein